MATFRRPFKVAAYNKVVFSYALDLETPSQIAARVNQLAPTHTYINGTKVSADMPWCGLCSRLYRQMARRTGASASGTLASPPCCRPPSLRARCRISSSASLSTTIGPNFPSLRLHWHVRRYVFISVDAC